VRAVEVEFLGAIGDQALAADGPGKRYGPNGKIQKARRAPQLPGACSGSNPAIED